MRRIILTVLTLAVFYDYRLTFYLYGDLGFCYIYMECVEIVSYLLITILIHFL